MPKYSIHLDKLDAFIFDLDGVITSTEKLHTEAWKKTFDDFLKKRSSKDNSGKFKAFGESDYRNYVDGKPRYDGAKDFLKSRGISLPFGNKDDPPEKDTICGIGNRKDDLYLKLLHKKGAKPFKESVKFIEDLRSRGIKTAIFSSSRNCEEVLEATHTKKLFDAKVDGVDLEKLKMPGKPDPAMLVEATKRVGSKPDDTAIVEDSLAGVEAGKLGKFALVIGIIGSQGGTKLKDKGADIAVSDLGNLVLKEDEGTKDGGAPPSALESKRPTRLITSKEPAMFLDYDGTLTEIVKDPSKAKISKKTRNIVRKLASLCRVAILSGRDVKDVMKLVKVKGIVYAGSHGFDIVMPDGKRKDNPRWNSFLPVLDDAEEQLRNKAEDINGAFVERKKFAISVHFRNVQESEVKDVKSGFNSVASEFSSKLRESDGKKVLELLPKVKWNKGEALLYLLSVLKLGKNALPVFLGDDVTDEDAFKAIREKGIGIIVTEKQTPKTSAKYSLRDPKEVREFLVKAEEKLREEGKRR